MTDKSADLESNETTETTCLLRDTSVQTTAEYSDQELVTHYSRLFDDSSLSGPSVITSSSDYNLTEKCSGTGDVKTDGDNISIRKWRSLSSISTTSRDGQDGLKSYQTEKSCSINSLFITHKSSTSLHSQDETGTADITPVQKSKNICHSVCSSESQRSELNKNKCFCLSLTWCSFRFWLGIALCLYPSLLVFGFWSFRKISETVEYVEGPIPHYASAATMTLCGLLTIFSSVKKHRYLIILILVLSIICTIFCTISLAYLLSQVHGRLTQLEDCSFDTYYRICSCYIKSGDRKKLFRFAEVRNCRAVKQSLRELVYGVTSLFAIGCMISISTAASSCFLLCKDQRNRLVRITDLNILSDSTDGGLILSTGAVTGSCSEK